MKRSTPLRRTSSLRTRSTLARRTRLSPRSKTNSHARRPRGKAFMGWTAKQPCMVARFWQLLHFASGVRSTLLEQHLQCEGRIEVDHAGCRFTQGNGRRAFDWTVIPACTRHHVMRTNWAGTLGQAGIFHGYSLESLRRWCSEAIRIHHTLAKRAGIEVPTC